MEVVKEDLNSIDKWVTGLVDLIPTQVYVSHPYFELRSCPQFRF